jgi:hypothetical protein
MTSKKQKRETAKAQRSKSDGRVPSPPQLDDEELVFSFKDLDFSTDKYSISKLTADEVELLFTRLREHCQNPFREFITPPGNPNAIRSHLIRFSATSESDGFTHILHDRWKERPSIPVGKNQGTRSRLPTSLQILCSLDRQRSSSFCLNLRHGMVSIPLWTSTPHTMLPPSSLESAPRLGGAAAFRPGPPRPL